MSTASLRRRPSAFNNHANYDPFLSASSPFEEDLLPATFHQQPHYQQDTVPSASQGSTPSGTYSSTLADHEGVTPRTANGINVGSPQEFGHEFGQEFGNLNGFGTEGLAEFNFGFDDPLPIPDHINTNLFDQDALMQFQSDSISPAGTGLSSRKSTGLATMSSQSQLMSPTLTNHMASPTSVTDEATMFDYPHARLLGGGEMSRVSSESTAVDLNGPMYRQATPAMTRASAVATPELASSSKFSSPTFKFETYRRGDSPARVPLIDPSYGKRSRDGSSSAGLVTSEEQDKMGMIGSAGHTGIGITLEDVDHAVHERTGLDPSARTLLAEDPVTSLNEQQDWAKLQAKNNEVTSWLTVKDAGPGAYEEAPLGVRKYEQLGRRRSKSASNTKELSTDVTKTIHGRRAVHKATIPGPNVLIDEISDQSDDNDDDDDDVFASRGEYEPAVIDLTAVQDPSHAMNMAAADVDLEPQPEEAHPWIDSIRFLSQDGHTGQPETSQLAMSRFEQRARDIDTASRAATWGTRRMSDGELHRVDGELQRVFGSGGLLSRFHISRHREKEKDDARSSLRESIDNATAKFRAMRSNSVNKRKTSETARHPSAQDEFERKTSYPHSGRNSAKGAHDRKESLGSISATLSRTISGVRPRTPNINTSTSGLVATLATQVAALGATGNMSPPTTSPVRTWSRESFKRSLRDNFNRHTSHDGNEGGSFPWHQHILTSRVTLSPPANEEPESIFEITTAPTVQPNHTAEDEDGESDEIGEEKGIKMDLAPRHDFIIIPNFEGFKQNIRDLNPGLEQFLVERLGQEQLRRYKKLVGYKVKHAGVKERGVCVSGAQCVAKGGQPKYFPSKASQKELVRSHTGFTVAGIGEVDEDEEAAMDGVITEAQFPGGVPMPPARVKSLPAEFECPLCFQVKKFMKPSDWSKHVHEDLQPFTCTFKECPEPKSFKRKADWVRHENERHRHLEWWQCTEEGCSHQCYRRDNFVQHLVREHKMPEPKAKTIKPNKPAVRGPAKPKPHGNTGSIKDIAPEDKVLVMVETCRRLTEKQATDEPCRFCGNMVNSWKKLTVHLAKHMEQISIPVVGLVEKKEVSPDTIVSPIELKLEKASASPNGVAQSAYIHNMAVPSTPSRAMHADNGLPASFVSLQSTPTFTTQGFDNSVYPWPIPATAVQPTMAYDPTMNNVYHANAAAAMYNAPGVHTGYMHQQPAVLPPNAYTSNGQALQHFAYGAADQGYGVLVSAQPQYGAPMYVDGHMHVQPSVVSPTANMHAQAQWVQAQESNRAAHANMLRQQQQQQQQQQFYNGQWQG